MSQKFAFVMDPITSINIKKDTTYAMLVAAKMRDIQLFYLTVHDIFIADGQAKATVRSLTLNEKANPWYQLEDAKVVLLSDFDVIFMRKDPPFDMEYIYCTYMLEMAEREGTLVVNKPQSLRDCNEKVFATFFPECTPAHIISKNKQCLVDFFNQHQDVIFKPLDGMGGKSIFRVKPDGNNLFVVIETLTQLGQVSIMAQKYLPEIVDGDKRILLVHGEPIPYALARIPAKGEIRGNLAAGGHGEVRALTERDHWICAQLKNTLLEKGLYFVGIDVIGDYLTEINVTSPTCLQEIGGASKIDIAGLLIDNLAKNK